MTMKIGKIKKLTKALKAFLLIRINTCMSFSLKKLKKQVFQ
jgi:hypothetical protein